jgi:subtilisin family serine protease
MPVITAEGATVAPTTIAGLYTVQGPTAKLAQLAADLSTDPAVEYANPVQMVRILTVPNDTDYVNGAQWQLNGTWGVNAPAAWSVTTGSDSVIVADVDTGLNYNLPDIYDNVWLNQPEIPASVIGNLTDVNNDGVITFSDLNNAVNQGAGKIQDKSGDGLITGADVLAASSAGGWVNPGAPNTQDGFTLNPDDLIGWNFMNNTNDPMDGDGHGTFTAGEIGEMTDNTIGGAGLVWNAQIMPVKFLDSSGNGTDTAAAEAIDYAVNHGAKVVNASWGAGVADPTIEAAINYADDHGVIIVAAAGNGGQDDGTTFFSPASYSAQYSNVIAVAAVGSDGSLASFSNYGVGTVQLAAPGVNVYSTLSNGSYGTDSGTSTAAPLVAGTIALVEAAHPTWTMQQVVDAVLDTVTADPALAGKVTTGGVVNAGAAVANTNGPYVVTASPESSITSSAGLTTVQLTFNEEINPATFTAAQISLSGPNGVIPDSDVSVSAVDGSNDHEFQVSFPAQTISGTYTLTVGPDIEDWYGNEMNQNRSNESGEASDAYTDTIQFTDTSTAVLLSVTAVPSVASAGAAENVTVAALNSTGATDTSYIGTIDFASTDSQAVLPADYTFTAADRGIHAFTVTFKTAGSQSVTAADTTTPSVSGSDSNIVVQAAAAETLTIAGFPTKDVAGTTNNIRVTAFDEYGNVAAGYAGTLEFSSSDGHAVLLSDYTFTTGAGKDNGVHIFTATLETAGTQSISARDTLTGTIAGALAGIDRFTISPAAAVRLVIAAQPSSRATAGQAFRIQPTVYEEDEFGNVETGDNSTVVSASLSAGIGPLQGTRTVTVSSGVASFSDLADNAAETISLTMNSGALEQAISSTIDVGPAAATQLVVTTPPPDALVAGQAFTLVVSAEDRFGNLDTTYSGKVTLSVPDDPGFAATVQAKSGVATFLGLTLNTAADGKAIRAAASNLSAAVTNPLTVSAPEPPPTIIGELVLMARNRNKKGKAAGRPITVISLEYSAAMNPSSAGSTANYRIDSTMSKHVKKKKIFTVQQPVRFASAYSSATNTVRLTIKGKPNFASGGEILVTASPPGGVASASGLPLDGRDSVLTILPKAKGIEILP